ncbi:MAG: hypothetical protein PHQ12_06440 [Chthoniobacteraceae bacterium]|nr:hypothetical protein [Chthoniobacteraceae bacterium]
MNWRDNPIFSLRPGSLWPGMVRLTLVLCLLGLGTGSVDAKTRTKTKKNPSSTPEASPSATPADKSLDIPIPIGRTAKGVRIPLYAPDGKLQMLFESQVAFRMDAQQLQLTALKIATYDDEEKPEMSIDMPQSVLNLKTRILTSTDPVTVRRTDMELVGGNMVFDTQTRQGKFTGPVRMLIYNLNNEAEKPQESATGE